MSWWRWFYPKQTHGEEVELVLRDARPRPLAESKPGAVVTIEGTVESIEPPIAAPLTGRRCVYWALAISEVMKMGLVVELGNLGAGAPFFVVDPAARCRVVPDGAHVAGPQQSWLRALLPAAVTGKWSRHSYEPELVNAAERALLAPLGIRIQRSSRLRLTEYVIEDRARVRVRGWSESEPEEQGAEVGYREMATRLVLGSAKRKPLLIRVNPGRSSVQASAGP